MRLIRCISASAGTGKTYKINSLIKSLVESGVNPSSILCITFTKHSANEMERRYSLSVGDSTSKPHFKTIHSFANFLIDNKLSIIDDEEQEDLLKEAVEMVCSENKWSNFFESSEYEFGNIISDAKYMISNYMVDSEKIDINKILEKIPLQRIELSKKCQEDLLEAKLKSFLEKVLSNDYQVYQNEIVTKNYRINKRIIPDSFLNNPRYSQSSKELQKVLKTILNMVINNENNQYLRESLMINLFIKEVYQKYNFIKEVNGLIDYAELISTSLMNLNLEKIMNFSHIFLDEAQDTSEHQWNFMMTIIEEIFQKEDTSFTIVGDEKQIIYQFNNNSSENYYNKIKNQLKKMVEELNGKWIEETLEKSYRSPKVILEFIDSVMNSTKYPTKHEPASGKFGYIKTWEEEETSLKNASQDWQIQEKPKVPKWVEICINQIKELVGKKLLNENRRVEYSDITILISKRCSNTFVLAEEIRKTGIPIKESPFYIIQREIVQELVSIAELCLNIENDLNLIIILRGSFFRFLYKDIENICVDRETSVWEKMITMTEDKIIKAVETINRWMSFPKDAFGFFSSLLFHEEYGSMVQKLFYDEVLIFWEILLEFSNRSNSLSEFILHLKNIKRGFYSNRDGISICTIHSAKGRENNIIFLCTSQSVSKKQNCLNIMQDNILLLKGNYKLYKQAKTKEILFKEMEADRLLYVALTRAKEQLYILPPGEIQQENSWYTKIIQNQDLLIKTDSIYETSPAQDTKKSSQA